MQKNWVHRIGKSWTAMVLCCALVFGTAVPVCAQDELTLASEAAILMDAETGQILYEKNGHNRMYPASITKVMTGLLALTHLSADAEVTVSEEAVDAVPRTSSHIGLRPGEILTLDQAMYALAMQSANDMANVLAEAVSGSQEAFAELMTETARELGAENTHFTNANGLPDEGHYTTAYDMARITAAALKVPGFTDYFSTVHYACAATNNYHAIRNFENKNQILPGGPYYYEGVLMSKTGWTSSALGTLVTAVKRGDTTLIAVVMKSEILESKYEDTWALMDYGFSRYSRVKITGEEIASHLNMGQYVPERDQEMTLLLPVGKDVADIAFSVADGVDLTQQNAQQLPVTIRAEAGGQTLLQTHLTLRYKPKTVAQTITQTIVDSIEQPESHNPIPWMVGAVILLILVLYLGAILIKRHNLRRYQRSRLEGRIRKMKMQMELPDQPEEEMER